MKTIYGIISLSIAAILTNCRSRSSPLGASNDSNQSQASRVMEVSPKKYDNNLPASSQERDRDDLKKWLQIAEKCTWLDELRGRPIKGVVSDGQWLSHKALMYYMVKNTAGMGVILFRGRWHPWDPADIRIKGLQGVPDDVPEDFLKDKIVAGPFFIPCDKLKSRASDWEKEAYVQIESESQEWFTKECQEGTGRIVAGDLVPSSLDR